MKMTKRRAERQVQLCKTTESQGELGRDREKQGETGRDRERQGETGRDREISEPLRILASAPIIVNSTS